MGRTISAAQFFGMMFVSRITITIALNAQYAAGESLLDGILSYLGAMGAAVLIALPLWRLHRRHPALSIGEMACREWGRWGRWVPWMYALYFLVVNGASLALFHLFLLDTVNPDFSAALVVAAIVAVAVYGACQGLETVARCAACVLVLLVLASALVFAIVARRFSSENLEPLLAGGGAPVLRGGALFLSRTSLFADMAVLLPFVRGRKTWGFAAWVGGTSLFVGVLIALIAGCLGPYAYTQNFPVYALASITEVRSMQRLDAVFIGIWMMGLIIKVGCDLYACRVCLAPLLPGKKEAVPVVLAGILLVGLAVAIASFLQMQYVFMHTGFWLLLTGMTGLVIPLALLLTGWIRRRVRKEAVPHEPMP